MAEYVYGTYAHPKRKQHEPYHHPSEPPRVKETEITKTHWGLFDQFMERIEKHDDNPSKVNPAGANWK